MIDSNEYEMYKEQPPTLVTNDPFNGISYQIAEIGGPFYVEAGRRIEIESISIVD
jgi:hypothetical protein